VTLARTVEVDGDGGAADAGGAFGLD
jgi:hypothetical protein